MRQNELAKQLVKTVVEDIKLSNGYADGNSYEEHRFYYGRACKGIEVLDIMGYSVYARQKSKLQYGLKGGYRFERITKLTVLGKVVYEEEKNV